jgi:hypothetical protein
MVNYGQATRYFELADLSEAGHIDESISRTEILPSTANALELKFFYENLFPKTKTVTGATMLAHSLIAPPKDTAVIKERQEAVRELKEKDDLRKKLDSTLDRIYYSEKETLGFLTPRSTFFQPDLLMPSARELIKTSIEELGSLDQIESPYLRKKVEKLKRLKKSDIHKLSEGMIYRQGLRTPLHAGQLNWKCFPWIVPNTLASFRPLTGAIVSGLTGLILYGLFSQGIEGVDKTAIGMLTACGALITGAAGLISGWAAGLYERGLCLPPLIRKLRGDEGARTAYSSFGIFDEILTLSKFAIDMEEKGHQMTLPEIVDSKKQGIYCENLVNLVQADKEKYIPNKKVDFGSNGERITFVTGPNSGGKTSSSKAVCLLQILGQMGSYGSVSNAVLSPADKIIYQVGINDSQIDQEGGYGTQLWQTRKILENAGTQSLVVVDDLMSGTEEGAMTKQTRNQFYALYHTRANVVMITHRHDLAKEFKEKTGKGNYLQIEFDGDYPTRQLIQGIAPTSRSDLVEARVNMGEGAIENLLRERGFLKDDQSLYDLN